MFGYISPYKLDLRVRDYNLYKTYYCSLCKQIKKNYGNLPTLSNDTIFLAIFLDSLETYKTKIDKELCIISLKKFKIITNSNSLDYISHINFILTYNKLIDDINDEKTLNSRLKNLVKSTVLDRYKNKIPSYLDELCSKINDELDRLRKLEESDEKLSIDEYSDPFAKIMVDIINCYIKKYNINGVQNDTLNEILYNVGKWVYILDAYDDIQEDYNKNRFNAIINSSGYEIENNMSIEEYKISIKDRIEMILNYIGATCLENFSKLGIVKNYELIENFFQLGFPSKVESILSNSKANCKSEEQ